MSLYKRIVILTGAGLSAESGVGTFRDKDGIWSRYDVNDVATPEGFARNPDLVHEFYNNRRQAHKDVKPNAAHYALAALEQQYPGDVLTITQNVDALHEQAGTKNLIHMHGEIHKAMCMHCKNKTAWYDDLTVQTACPSCGKTGGMRPDVVWFGEFPYHMEEIFEALSKCDLFMSIGTSGTVYPAAGFVADARQAQAHTVELNLEPSEGASMFHEVLHGLATEIVPLYVKRLFNG